MHIRHFALLIFLLATGSQKASLAKASDIYDGINHIRLSQCQNEGSAKQVLAPSPELENAAQRRANGEPLAEALSGSPAEFSSAYVLVIGGDIKIALARLANRHCDKLTDAGFTHVGVVFAKNRWWIVLGSKESESTQSAEMASSHVVVSEDIADVFLKRINAARSQARNCGENNFQAATPVAWDNRLTGAAVEHAKDMASRRYFAHISPENQSVADRVRATGYRFRAIGENIAAVPADNPALVVEGWLRSPGHCANIMSSQFSDIGAAVARVSGSQQGKWVLVLGSPQ